jgi:hypothetical protein
VRFVATILEPARGMHKPIAVAFLGCFGSKNLDEVVRCTKRLRSMCLGCIGPKDLDRV